MTPKPAWISYFSKLIKNVSLFENEVFGEEKKS